MKIYTTRIALENYLDTLRENQQSVGLVPTMGALHAGHLALIAASRNTCDYTLCSIFVNPTQFNDPADLENYPRTIEEDTAKLEEAGCDILFMPPYAEMYGENEHWHIDLDGLDNVLEGAFRPGHFQGVTQVVYKLFTITAPDLAFFGQKDFQQFQVIEKMTAKLRLAIKLIMCPIIREPDGLAMSSRNVRLPAIERQQALALSRALKQAAAEYGKLDFDRIRENARHYLEQSPGIDLEYVEIADPETLAPATVDTLRPVVLIAARVGGVRLIDNAFLGGESF